MSWKAWLTFAVLGVIWGLPYFFLKLALVELSPACVAWGRIALGAAVMLPIAWKRGALRSLGEHKGALLGYAFAELVGPFLLIAIGESWISSSLAGILVATVVRFFAYRFLVFNQELDQEPEFSHDHEIIEVHHHDNGEPVRGGKAAAASAQGAEVPDQDASGSARRP